MPHHWHIALIAFISPLGICFIGNDFTGINIKSDIFTVIECGFKERFICLSQSFKILALSKPVKMHYLKTPTSKNLE
jgi:hypothetical protein